MFSDFLSELRRRNVLKTGGAYVAGGWVFFQIAATLFPLAGAPDWVLRVLLILLVMGLPFMVAFAWAFELTPEGLKRTEEVDPAQSQTKETGRKIQYLMIGLLSVAVGVLAADRFLGGSPAAPSSASGSGAARVAGISTALQDGALAVMPFRTSGPETEVWREGMMDMLTTNLDGMGDLQGVSTRTVLARLRETGQQNPDLPTTLRAAQAAGASMALVGEVISTGETVRLTAALHDTGSGDIRGRLQVEGAAENFLDLVDRLTVQAVEAARSGESGQALPVPELSALTTESLPALRAYLAGEDLLRQSRYRDALARFTQAVQLDSTFAMAHLRRGVTTTYVRDMSPEMVAGMQDDLRAARRHGERLPPRETALLEGFSEFVVAGDVAQTVERVRAGAEAHPTDPELWFQYGETLYYHPNVRPDAIPDGLAALRRAVRLDSSLTSAYAPLAGTAISTGDTAAARRLLAAYDRHDGDAGESGVLASLRAARDLAYGDSTAQAQVLQQLRDGAFPVRGIFLKLALETNPSADALAAQRRFGEVLLGEEGFHSVQTLAWIFGGQYEALRAFVRDTTQASRSARLRRQQAAAVLLERGALAPSAIPARLTEGGCAIDLPLLYRLPSCYYQARIAAHRQRAGFLAPEEAADAMQTARSVLGQTIRELEAAGDGAYGTLAQGYRAFLDEMAALDAGDTSAARRIQGAYRPLVLVTSLGEWEPMAASVRAQLRAGRTSEALPYAQMIAAQDPYGHYLAGRAHEAAGNAEAARQAYAQFTSAWRDADPEIPALQHAKAVLDGDASADAPPL